MGCPTNSIKELENGLRCRNQKMVIVILASANSDSRATDFVLRNFHEMDILSDDVDFYLPGYGINKYEKTLKSETSLECVINDSEREFPDFHTRRALFPLFKNEDRVRCIDRPRCIDSPRLGRIVFNVAEFTDFVLEFTRRIDGFHYLGGCQMVLLRPTKERTPNYDEARVYDLDAIINSPSGLSLDSFFFRTFQTIRNGSFETTKQFRNPLLRKIFTQSHNKLSKSAIINRLDALYAEATRSDDGEERYKIIVQNIILDMNRCLHWDISEEEFYFISYSSKNVMQAETLKMLLQDNRIHVWIAPDGIPQGREYPLVIPTALKLAKTFVLLLTPDSAKSQWVRRELAIAINNYVNTKVKVVLSGGFTVSDIRSDNELEFLLDRVQIRYQYSDLVHSSNTLKAFIDD